MAQPPRADGSTRQILFGADKGWDADDWTRSDDTVRGGKSKSHFGVSGNTAHFYGTLDITALGGAGFASQRTVDHGDRVWNLEDYAGIQLNIARGDKKRYTFIVKDQVLPPDPDTGREQSTISWECDFELPPQTRPGDSHNKSVFIPWASFNPTYRGKVQKDVSPLDRKAIKRFSLMMRSFFGTQQGDFSLYIESISAEPNAPPPSETFPTGVDAPWLEKGIGETNSIENTSSSRRTLQIKLGSYTIDWRHALIGACLIWMSYRVFY